MATTAPGLATSALDVVVIGGSRGGLGGLQPPREGDISTKTL
jgi:hypothetical protein